MLFLCGDDDLVLKNFITSAGLDEVDGTNCVLLLRDAGIPGAESLSLFLSAASAEITVIIRELKGCSKVNLFAGEEPDDFLSPHFGDNFLVTS